MSNSPEPESESEGQVSEVTNLDPADQDAPIVDGDATAGYPESESGEVQDPSRKRVPTPTRTETKTLTDPARRPDERNDMNAHGGSGRTPDSDPDEANIGTDANDDPAHATDEDEGWTSEGGATPSGPATDVGPET